MIFERFLQNLSVPISSLLLRYSSFKNAACEKLRIESVIKVKEGVAPLNRGVCSSYLHDSYVIGEGGDSQPFDHDVRQVVGVQHQVIPAVLQQLLVVLALVLPHMPHCSGGRGRERIARTGRWR